MALMFSPGQIGTLQVRNRFVMTPMHLGYCPTGEVTDQLVEFYRVRAHGGVGLIIVGGCGIDRIGNAFSMIQLDEDSFIPGLRRLTNAIQAEGAKTFAQLFHAGRYAASSATNEQPVAPSAIRSKLSKDIPRELTEDEIKGIIAAYASAAQRAKEGGFDGVEVLASAGYLISEFLSPVTNKRTDRYGGDLYARMTFPLEILSAIREAVGQDYPISFRIAGNDFVPGSNTNEEAKLFCQALEKAGVNLLDVTGGWHESTVPQITMNVPPGAYSYLAQGIKESVSIPVVACNRINSVELAEKILEEGQADFIGMARPLIADPELPNKANGGQLRIIRTCIACNQGCLDNIFRFKPVACLVNAEAGREAELVKTGKVLPIKAPSFPFGPMPGGLDLPEVTGKKVLVIGAGAAGLEFARTARMRGHNVIVWEEREMPGGQLGIAAAPPGRHDFAHLRTFLVNTCMGMGIPIKYGQKATAENVLATVKKEKFEHVVIATGAQPVMPQIPTEEGARVVQSWMVLGGRATVGENVVIIGGGAVGIETAHFLAEKGTVDNSTMRFLYTQGAEKQEKIAELLTRGTKKITLVEMLVGIGRDVSISNRWSMLQDLKRYHIDAYDQTTVREIKRNGVIVEHNDEQRLIPADTIVLAIGSRPQNELYTVLKDRLPSLSIIGDAVKPRKAMEAIHEGYDAAMNL